MHYVEKSEDSSVVKARRCGALDAHGTHLIGEMGPYVGEMHHPA